VGFRVRRVRVSRTRAGRIQSHWAGRQGGITREQKTRSHAHGHAGGGPLVSAHVPPGQRTGPPTLAVSLAQGLRGVCAEPYEEQPPGEALCTDRSGCPTGWPQVPRHRPQPPSSAVRCSRSTAMGAHAAKSAASTLPMEVSGVFRPPQAGTGRGGVSSMPPQHR